MTAKIETVKSRCNICRQAITIIKGRSNVCDPCKASLAYIARNHEFSWDKIESLKLRLEALIISKNNPKLAIAESLRQAIKNARRQR